MVVPEEPVALGVVAANNPVEPAAGVVDAGAPNKDGVPAGLGAPNKVDPLLGGCPVGPLVGAGVGVKTAFVLARPGGGSTI